jgi:hypothetical protein
MRVIKSIRDKLKDNDATITRADKWNSTVILPTQQYISKIPDFIDKTDFRTSTSDPTKPFQTLTRKVVRNSPTLIPKEQRWRYMNMNPSAPSIKGLIKLHKPTQPSAR